MKHLLVISCLVGSFALLGGSCVQAQQTPPCPFNAQVDTTRLSGSTDSSRLQVVNNVFYRKGGQDKLEGFYIIDFYRKWTDPDAGLYNYRKEHTGYEQGGFLDGLKEGPWKCVRYLPIGRAWWECYRSGQLVSTTAPPSTPEKRQHKGKVPARPRLKRGRKTTTIPRCCI